MTTDKAWTRTTPNSKKNLLKQQQQYNIYHVWYSLRQSTHYNVQFYKYPKSK